MSNQADRRMFMLAQFLLGQLVASACADPLVPSAVRPDAVRAFSRGMAARSALGPGVTQQVLPNLFSGVNPGSSAIRS